MKRNAVVMAASWALAALLLCGADTRAKVGSRMTPAQGSKPGDGESPFRTSGRPLRSIGPAGPVDTATLGEDVTAESHDGPARPPRGYELTPQALRAFREARLAARRAEEGTSAEPPAGTEPASFVQAGSLEQLEAPPGADAPIIRPEILTSFEAISDTGALTPDPTLAVGPDDVVVAVDSALHVFDKTGTRHAGGSLRAWFSNVLPKKPAGISVYDPYALYDPVGRRFVLVALARRTRDRFARFLVSVSDDSDAVGRWCNWSLDARLEGLLIDNWADYLRAGTTSNAIILSANMFSLGGFFAYAKVRVLPKSQFYDTTCPARTSYLDFVDLRNEDGTKASSVVPAHNFGNRRHDYLVNFHSLAGDTLTLWRLDTPTALTASLSRETRPIYEYELPPDAPQPGTTARLDTGDARALNAVYRGRYLWAGHSVQCSWSTIDDCYSFVKIDTTTDSWSGGSLGGPAGSSSYQPAVMVAPTGRWLVAFHRSSDTTFAGSEFYAYRGSVGPQGGTLREGEACFQRGPTLASNAWGRNTGIALDPSDGTFWVIGAFATGTSTDCRRNGWSTHVTQIRW